MGFPPPFVFLGLTLAGVALQRWLWPLTLPTDHPLRVGAGAAIAASGLTLVLNARLWFVRTGQHPPPGAPPPSC